MTSPGTRPAALGFSPHIGWAAVVAISGARAAPAIVAKRRVDMATTFETGAVYHAGQKLPLARAEALVRSSEEAFEATARAASRRVIRAPGRRGRPHRTKLSWYPGSSIPSASGVGVRGW